MSMPAKDKPGVHLPAMERGQAPVDAGTRAQALLYLLRRGHRDIAIMLGLLPDGSAT